jgi:hypothetical protein
MGSPGQLAGAFYRLVHRYDRWVVEQRRNPLDEWVSFPEGVVESRQDMLPSESHGWGLNLVLAMPRPLAFAFVRAQLITAGFADESANEGAGLFRFIRDDAYVWGSVANVREGGSRVLLSCNTAAPGPPAD